ncbi:prepilin-type N-terminal cleavage/methylation domain-containing protein [Candidatus Gracilibacteria bacterium]|nr:prepilin-type N-terminal cleavage/methylation domain-containing protein [Candidatus Gracilibacteria bacterium]
MQNNNYNYISYKINQRNRKISGFTLVEVIVALTILSLIMISVMFIFINSSQLSAKIDINRVLQENSKNILETISEDVKKNGISKCGGGITVGCISSNFLSSGNELRVGSNHYYIAKKSENLGEYIKVDDMTYCSKNQCFLMKNGVILSNSYVTIHRMFFNIINEHIPKLQINMIIRPATGKGVNSNLINNNELNIQTTISENYFKN